MNYLYFALPKLYNLPIIDYLMLSLLEFSTFFLAGVVCLCLIVGFVDLVIEPAYILIFKKPMYLYWYPRLKKLSQAQRKILFDNVSFYRRLSDRKKKYFEHRLWSFLNIYQFYGNDGIIITDQIKTMIGSTYIMLTFGMRHYLTDVFDKIIVYPDSYHSTINDALHNGEFNAKLKAIVFSWRHFMEGFEQGSDNLNLGIHEFAHAIHFHGLKKRDHSAAIFSDMYTEIMREVMHPPNAKRLIESEYFRIYAYTNQFEFLAVILEHFFETPSEFKREFPELFKKVKQMINYTE